MRDNARVTAGATYDDDAHASQTNIGDIEELVECLTGDAERDQECFRALLATVSEVLAETDLDRLLVRLVDHILRTSGSERGLLLLRDGDEELSIRVARDSDRANLDPDFEFSRQIPRKVMDEDRPIIARVSGEGEILDLSQSIAALRLRQVMCAPIRAGGAVIGVLYTDSTLAGPSFTPSDLMLFNAQAGLTGMAIHNHQLHAESRKVREMAQQFRVARDIQRRLLPDTPARIGETELAGVSRPSNRVGGDYFDYFPIDLDRVGIVIADVSGHGIGPALIMSNVRAHLRSVLLTRHALGGLYGLMNRALCADLGDGMFVSLFVAVYDRSEHRLEFQNAGHTAPLLYNPENDRFREIVANAPALGILDDISAGPCPSIRIDPGEYLLCYTDGVTEMHDRDGKLFGEQRVREVIRKTVHAGGAPTDLVEALRFACDDHAQGLPPRDDLTVVAAKF